MSVQLGLISREGQRLKVPENRVLRYVSEPKKDVTGDWRKLHTEKLYNLYCSHKYNSGYQSKTHERGEACGRYILSLGGGGICRKDTTPEDLSVEGKLILHGY
jgi:hypothetical protein